MLSQCKKDPIIQEISQNRKQSLQAVEDVTHIHQDIVSNLNSKI
jgi:hypothetical protein